MRFINNGNCDSAIDIFKCSYFEVFSWTASLNADGSWAGETEISGKGPETAGYFEGVASKADENGVTTRGVARVVLSAPPV